MRTTAVVVIALALAACGVQDDGEPRAIDPGNVPFSLLAPVDEEPTSTTAPASGTGRVTVYLLDRDGLLTAARRPVTGLPTVGKALEALLAGAVEGETELGSAITSETRLLGIEGPSAGLVTIDLSSDVLDITGRQQILALAQVVFTATSHPGVDRVLFKFDGTQREVPNGDGELTSEPLDRRQYRDLESE